MAALAVFVVCCGASPTHRTDKSAGGAGGMEGEGGLAGGSEVKVGVDTIYDAYLDECLGPQVSGGECEPAGLLCTYGAEPRPRCRHQASCDDGHWLFTPGACEPAFPGTPCSEDVLHGGECSEPGERCAASGQECECQGEDAPTWTCELPNTEPQCPEAIPNAGTLCDENRSCNYGNCQLWGERIEAVCDNGLWTWVVAACPAEEP